MAVLIIDNFDSFTYNLAQYFRVLGQVVEVVRNDAVSEGKIRRLRPDLIVISPGPKGPEDTGNCARVVETFGSTLPILGICLGMQLIARVYGAGVVEAERPMHGKVDEVRHAGSGIFRRLKSPLRVTRYHSLVVDAETLPACLVATAWSSRGEVMGLEHKEYPLFGVQFHPEALLTEQGLDMLDNALKLAVPCSSA